ncbi:unnamed protein product [Rotaria sp. Silwood1]|nr:unnamed protein product [Rotaria sp. Silwood1]CAF1667796.1 unnamed protein product [Rotaria sp. Silwood1]CAF4967488.1 unnamed protein product [Rotaria sp. Silwood1]CAF5025888.1 unnamed protein product [Rotaria sp. Silwood1]
MQRVPSSCIEITVQLTDNGSTTDNCLTYDWSQITNLTTNYTTYIDPNTNQTYYVRIGALTVLGTMDNYSLNYKCPPMGYNGVGSGCQTEPNTQLVVLQVNALDGKLYIIDIILSGVPFPSSQDLKENQPPFGKARITFNSGVALQPTGYFQICKHEKHEQCPNQNISAYKLPHPLPSNYGYGIFGIQALNLITNSTWIMDDPNQLLIITAGTTYYYFNATGFFLYDSDSKICTWSATCNYVCEAYNYDSRFLDYAGEWIITNKWGIETMEPINAKIWIGNAIDAAGVFPIVMYTDKTTGHYLGLDKLDSIPSSKMGATYWYTEHGDTIPRVNIKAFSPSVVQAGCVAKLRDWTGPWKNFGNCVKPGDVRIMLVPVFLNIFQAWLQARREDFKAIG